MSIKFIKHLLPCCILVLPFYLLELPYYMSNVGVTLALCTLSLWESLCHPIRLCLIYLSKILVPFNACFFVSILFSTFYMPIYSPTPGICLEQLRYLKSKVIQESPAATTLAQTHATSPTAYPPGAQCCPLYHKK